MGCCVVLIYMQCASLGKDVKILLLLIYMCVPSVWILYVVAWFYVEIECEPVTHPVKWTTTAVWWPSHCQHSRRVRVLFAYQTFLCFYVALMIVLIIPVRWLISRTVHSLYIFLLEIKFWVVESVFVLAENLLNWAQSVASGFSPQQTQFDRMWSHISYVVDKVTLGQILSEYVRLHCQISFHQLFCILYHYITDGV
jgi:hypothetical protein